MARKFARSLLLLAFLLPVAIQVHALGLGNISTKTALNQPLVAEIELVSPAGVPLDEMHVRLAPMAEFTRAGLERPFFLTDLSFTVERRRNGAPYVKVVSKNPIREPYLDFLVELNWPEGRVLREYTLLLDPPTFTREPPPPVRAPVTAPRAAEPVAAPAPAQKRAPVRAGAPTGYAANTYAVARGDTLWDIAMSTRPDAGVSPQRMMLALQRKNPNAFVGGNINNLMAGVVLKLPTEEELARIGKDEALQATKKQNAAWRQQQAPVAALEEPPVVAAEPAAAEAPAEEASPAETKPGVGTEETPVEAAAEAPAEPEAELKILTSAESEATVAPAGEAPGPEGEQTEATAETTPPDLQEKLALTTEQVEALERENQELRSRFTDLESQVDSMQRLLNLREQELARLQAQAAQATAEKEKPLSRLLNEPANLLILVLAIVVVWVILWLAMRRRNRAAAGAGPLPASFASPAIPPEPQPAPAPVPASTPQPEPRADDTGEVELPDDPVAEADVYMAYGRFSQAEEMLRAAIAAQPSNNALQLKLLEVYHATGDRDVFEQEAADLHTRVSESDPVWQKAAEMGREIAPDSPLFGGLVEALAPVAPEAPESLSLKEESGDWLSEERSPEPLPHHEAFEESGPDQHLEPHTEDRGIDFDLDFLKESAPGAAPAKPVDDLETVEFDLDALEREAKEALEQPAEEEGVAKYDLSGVEAETERAEDLAWEEPPAIEMEPDRREEVLSADISGGDLSFEPVSETGGKEAEKELDELDLLPDLDEVSTKLDLARAYLDMGDGAGAREILEEVLREGNEAQQQEARGLLDQLPA